MPIAAQWWTFSEGIVNYERDEPGVYELGNTNEAVVYIGSSNEVRRRLKEHLGESAGSCVKKNTAKYRVEYTRDYKNRERQLYDEHVRIHGKPPLCNDARP